MPEKLQVNPARIPTGVGSVSHAESIHEDTTAKWFLLSAITYFFIVGIIALIIAAKFVWPQLLGSVSILTYGRLRPLHVNGMLFGWLLAADMGLAYYLVPRLCGVKLWSEKLGVATAVIWNIIVLGAVVALPMGFNKGWEYAELPTPLSVLVVVAWVCFGINIFATIATRKYDQMYVSLWYIMGCILWTAFVYLTGNVALFFTTGVNQANLHWMYVHNAVGLIFTPIGLGLAYYFIPRAANTPLHSHKLSMIGFWALAFVYVWTGAHHMIHGPISEWLQTIAIVFSVMLLIPVWAVVYNFFGTMKGQWHQLRDNISLKFLMSGVVFYLLTCFQGPMHSLRSVNAIVSKTDWIPGHAHMAVLGAFSFFAISGFYYAIPRLFRTELHSTPLANWSFWFFMIGGLGMFVTLWLGGLWQGWQWNNASIPFIDTVKALKPVWTVRFFSGILIFLGITTFLFNIWATVVDSGGEPKTAVRPVSA
jgi:cytochrome c oxidase cbb3-type subunit 1